MKTSPATFPLWILQITSIKSCFNEPWVFLQKGRTLSFQIRQFSRWKVAKLKNPTQFELVLLTTLGNCTQPLSQSPQNIFRRPIGIIRTKNGEKGDGGFWLHWWTSPQTTWTHWLDLLSFSLKPGTTLRPGSPKTLWSCRHLWSNKCGVLWHSHPKKNGPESLGFLVVPKKTCLQNSCIKSFNPLIGPKKTVWNGPSSPFPSPGLPGVFVGVTLPETNILYPSKISYSKWNFHLPTIDPQGASC